MESSEHLLVEVPEHEDARDAMFEQGQRIGSRGNGKSPLPLQFCSFEDTVRKEPERPFDRVGTNRPGLSIANGRSEWLDSTSKCRVGPTDIFDAEPASDLTERAQCASAQQFPFFRETMGLSAAQSPRPLVGGGAQKSRPSVFPSVYIRPVGPSIYVL